MNKYEHRAQIKELVLEWNVAYQFPLLFDENVRESFSAQLVDSIRRVEYFFRLEQIQFDQTVADPNSVAFDPLKANYFFSHSNNRNEAFWMIFLFVHCGKHKRWGWNLIKNIYGNLGGKECWTWDRVTKNLEEFKTWLRTNHTKIKHNSGFGNHRKYQSLTSTKSYNMGDVVDSYINWVGEDFNHDAIIGRLDSYQDLDIYGKFHALYKSLGAVIGFGRTGRFDLLCSIGKSGLLEIEPGTPYLRGATGPLIGIKDLCGDNTLTIDDYEEIMKNLAHLIGGKFGNQVVEDAICNWQKNKYDYVYFAG